MLPESKIRLSSTDGFSLMTQGRLGVIDLKRNLWAKLLI